MSNSSGFSESSSGKGPAAGSSLSHRCNILSQYLKEKGGFGDLSLGMNALGGEATGFFHKQRLIVKSMDLLPSESGFGSANNSSSTKAETAQMTIFYRGQVIVLDNFPADKAKEVMLLASRNSLRSYSTTVSDLSSAFTNQPSETTNAHNEPARITPEPVAFDLPLARRNSLHRFLEKRKDRISTRSPYPKINGNNSIADGSPLFKQVESNNKSWLSLSAQRHY